MAATIYVTADHGGDLQAAMAAAVPGDIVHMENGTYVLNSTLYIGTGITLQGASEAGAVIDVNTGASWGIHPNGDNVVLEQFTANVITSTGTDQGYVIHGGTPPTVLTGLTIQDVTVQGTGSGTVTKRRAGVDIHGVDSVALLNVTSMDATWGNGIQFTGCQNVTVDGCATLNNAWGSLAVYVSGYFPPARICDAVTIDGGTCSFGESVVFTEDIAGYASTNISVTGYEYYVRNTDFRAGAEYFTYFLDTYADAVTAALAFVGYEDASSIEEIATGEFFTAPGMSIQAAIDAAAPGDVVNVDAGTYREQLYIDKSLDLVGAGSGVCTVEAEDPGARTIYQVTQWNGSVRNVDTCVGVFEAGTVNITGLTVDGRGTGPGDFYGIHFFDTSGSVTYCAIDGVIYPAGSGAQRVVNLVGAHSVGQTVNLDFSNNTMPDFQKGGILLMGPGCTFTVNDNVVNDVYTASIAGNGIQLSYGASGSTSGNVVQGVGYTGSGWVGTGILLFESGDITMDGDEVFDSQSGVNYSDWRWVYSHTVPVNLSLNNLNLHDNEWSLSTHLAGDGSDLNIDIVGCDILNSLADGVDLWGDGIDPWGGGYYTGWENGDLVATITDCLISGTAAGYDGLWTADLSGNTNNATVTITNTSFVGNGNSAINNDFPTASIDASGCYWNDVAGPTYGGRLGNSPRPMHPVNAPIGVTLPEGGHEDIMVEQGGRAGETIFGAIDYTPWLGGGTDTSPGFDGDFATLYVDDDSPQTGALGRVQEAVDLVTASTVNIAAGTYPGGVIIPTAMPMSLIGAGTTQTFLTGGMQLVDGVTDLTLQHFALTGTVVAGSIIRAGHPNHNFTMDHVLIDGEGATYAGRNSYAGGRMTGDVTVTNCEFVNVSGWSLFDSASSGWETVMGTVIFANNHIHECDGAVAFRGDNADRIDLVQCYGNVWENINDNFSSPSDAWACIEVHGVDVLEFHDNTMTNVGQNSWGEGQGLQTWRVGAIDIYDNDFVDCWQGIWLPGLGTEPAPTGSIHGCNFDPITDHAVFTTHGGGGFTSGILDARGNWWGHASGPYHATLNPAGLGNNVSDDVLFEPWLGMATLGITPPSSGPINCSQSSTLTFTYTPDAMSPPLRGYTIRVTATGEVSFTDADISINTGLVPESEYTDIVYNGPNDYTIDYAILGTTGGIDWVESFFDVTFHGDNAGAHASATVSFGSCELRDLDNAPIGAICDATASIEVDCLAPTVPTMTAEPAYTQGLSNTVAWSDESGSGAALYYAEAATDAGFTSLVGNSGWIAGLSHEFTGLTDGQIYYYRVKTKDALDNESAFSAAVSSTQDDSPPATSADALATYQTVATFDVAWTGADTDPGSGSFSGLATVELLYSFESGAWTSYGSFAASPISFTATDGDGDYEFYTVGTDNVGNVEAAGGADTTTQLDTTAPTGTFTINGGAVYTTTPGVTLNNTIADATSGINQMQFSDDDVTYSGWVAYAATYGWSLPGADGVKTVYAQFSDMAGNVYQTSDDIILDTAAPGAVSDVDATPGHEEVVVTWTDPGDGDLAGIEIWRAVWHITGGGNEQVSAYPEYDDDNPAEPVRPADYAGAVASAEWIQVGTAAAGAGTFTDGVVDRGVYYYELFAIDMATNAGPAAGANDRATNYHLGDVQIPYGGTVDAGDITVLGTAYGTIDGDGDYNDECDVGPTDTASGSGIPETDNVIGFEDLMIFALNYGVVTPMPIIEGSEIAHLTWFAMDDGHWALGLTEPCVNLKAVRLRARIPVSTEVTLTGGGLLEQQSGPVFLREISGEGLDVSLAVLGEGVVITGQGLLFSVTLPEGVMPTDIEIVVRDTANADLDFVLGATAVDDLPTVYHFAGNYPNPFNPKTRIAFDLPDTQFVRLVVFSADGRRVVTLLNEQVAAGRHHVNWDGRDDHGTQLASGVYFARFEAGPLKETHKMLLLK